MSLLVGGHRGRSLCVLILLRYLDAAALIKRVTDMESRCAWETISRFSPCPKLVMLGLVFYLTSSNMSVIHDMDYLIRLWHEDFEEEKNILCHLLRLIDILTFFYIFANSYQDVMTLRYIVRRGVRSYVQWGCNVLAKF